LRAQEFSQHPIVTRLAHGEGQYVTVETNDLAAPTALDHGRQGKFRFRQGIFEQNCHRDSFGTQASCVLNSSFFLLQAGRLRTLLRCPFPISFHEDQAHQPRRHRPRPAVDISLDHYATIVIKTKSDDSNDRLVLFV